MIRTPLHWLAEASAEVASTSKRTAKAARLAELFRQIDPTEAEAVVGLMLGAQRQGRIGIGWATIAGLGLEPAPTSSLTVADIDAMLDEVASISGPGSVAARASVLTATLSRATDAELDFLRQVLVGDLRQGALAGVVSDAVADAAGVKRPLLRRATMLRGDLPATAAIALADGATGLAAITLEVLRPVEPMLASTAETVADALDAIDGPASIEWKLDGARIQVHRSGDEVRVFTRNLNEISDRLPLVADAVRGFPAEHLVLDGEVLGLDADGAPLAFQDTASAVGQDAGTPDASARGLRPFFFDLLLCNDSVLIDEPLSVRQEQLRALVGDFGLPTIVTDDPERAQAHLDEAIAAGHEGVMVKAITTLYEAGRRGKGWRKVKPVHTLDLVVLAAEWGHGRRQGWLSNLHLGALDPDTGQPVMVGKTFKGMTDETLTWQTQALLDREVRRSSTGHTVYVEPTLVAEIALDGAQRSTRYPGGVALRFARLRGYRHDRNAASADTLDDVRRLLK